MLSRVAESIYWMARQVERAENLARFLEVTHNLSPDHPDALADPWTYDPALAAFARGPQPEEEVRQTFCGT